MSASHRPGYYRLIGRLAVPCANVEEWVATMGGADRVVAMIFDDDGNNYQRRCSTWDQAEAQHDRAVGEAAARVAAAEPVLRQAFGPQ